MNNNELFNITTDVEYKEFFKTVKDKSNYFDPYLEKTIELTDSIKSAMVEQLKNKGMVFDSSERNYFSIYLKERKDIEKVIDLLPSSELLDASNFEIEIYFSSEIDIKEKMITLIANSRLNNKDYTGSYVFSCEEYLEIQSTLICDFKFLYQSEVFANYMENAINDLKENIMNDNVLLQEFHLSGLGLEKDNYFSFESINKKITDNVTKITLSNIISNFDVKYIKNLLEDKSIKITLNSNNLILKVKKIEFKDIEIIQSDLTYNLILNDCVISDLEYREVKKAEDKEYYNINDFDLTDDLDINEFITHRKTFLKKKESNFTNDLDLDL